MRNANGDGILCAAPGHIHSARAAFCCCSPHLARFEVGLMAPAWRFHVSWIAILVLGGDAPQRGLSLLGGSFSLLPKFFSGAAHRLDGVLETRALASAPASNAVGNGGNRPFGEAPCVLYALFVLVLVGRSGRQRSPPPRRAPLRRGWPCPWSPRARRGHPADMPRTAPCVNPVLGVRPITPSSRRRVTAVEGAGTRIAVLFSENLDPDVYPTAGPWSNAPLQRNTGLCCGFALTAA